MKLLAHHVQHSEEDRKSMLDTSCSKGSLPAAEPPGGIFVLEVHAVVDGVINLSLGIIFDVQVELHANVDVMRVISISRVTNADAAAGHFVKVGI
jgi:hypothetical protein